MSKSQMRALCASGTADFLARGKAITLCKPGLHGRTVHVRNPHTVMRRWQFNAIASL